MRFRFLGHPASALVTLVVALALAGTAGVAAQGTSAPPPDLSGVIAEGTCEAPGQGTIQVGDFIRIDRSSMVGSTDTAFTLRAQRDIDSSLDALFGQSPYVFLVIDNTDRDGGPVACGALGGVNVNGQITVALTAPNPADAGHDTIVGVAIFGATTPTGPTTQPAVQPGQLPVQAYLAEHEQPTPEAPETTVPPTPEPPVAPTEVPPTLEPTVMPTMAPTTAPTMAPTAAPTMAPTEAPNIPPPPTTAPTAAPTTAPV